MKIVTYDQVDPVEALNLSMLALDFPFTPEHAAHIRKSDPRPFPCMAIYAIENDTAIGQVGIFRLPMISINGREDVGGIWAVSTHPQYAARGIASMLIDEAHKQMRAAGLRFSTLGTGRYRVAYRIYGLHGYKDMYVWGTALAPWQTAHQPTRLHAANPGTSAHNFIENLFEKISSQYLGFAWRYRPFARLHDAIAPENIWVIWDGNQPVGYALVEINRTLLNITNLVLLPQIDPTEAVAALSASNKTGYVQVATSRPAEIASLRSAGYMVAHPNWRAFMVKSLVDEISVEEARRLYAIGTDRFLISWLDVT